MPTIEPSSIKPNYLDVVRRPDGAFLVRVHSAALNGRQLPDAVFTFQTGDPQYGYWEQQWRQRNSEKT